MIPKFFILLVTFFPILANTLDGVNIDLECSNVPATYRKYKTYMKSQRKSNGEWVDTFFSRAFSSNSSETIVVDVTHSIFECDKKRIIHIQGEARAAPFNNSNGDLLFHRKCGKNVAIVNQGRTVQKINLAEPLDSVALTDRPLKNNEIFEIRLGRKSSKFSVSLGIGISTVSASDINIPKQMYKTPYAWMIHHTNIYSNGTEILSNYGANINEIEVGGKIGVMRSEFGTLHFFVNGVDQGPAASNIPYPVYGVCELYYSAAMATII